MPSNRPLKRTVGGIVLAAYLVGYLALLLIGQGGVLLAIPGFVVTVMAGLVNAPRRQRWSGVPGGSGAWAPFKIGAPLFAIVPGLLTAFGLVAVLSGGRGTPDIGNTGLVLPRAHYTLSNHGVQSEVEPWRFVVLGLLFFSLWFAGGSLGAWLVFFRPAPSIPLDPPAAAPRRSSRRLGGRTVRRALAGFVFAVTFIAMFVAFATLIFVSETYGGTAALADAQSGRYFVGYPGAWIEASKAVFLFTRWHTWLLASNLCLMAVSGVVHWTMRPDDEV